MRFSYLCGLLVSLVPSMQAVAQDEPLRVKIADAVYLVSDATVTDQAGNRVEDAAIIRKAAFTARVLDEQILKSGSNKEFFSVASRLRIFADEASGRLVEPWRTPNLADGSAADPNVLAIAKESFKAWANKIAKNRIEVALAVVRSDYRDGIAAFRQNAAIYGAAKQGQPLAYKDAVAFLDNMPATAQLASASALETSLVMGADTSGVQAAVDQSQLLRRLQSEVVGRVDSADSPRELDKVARSIKTIAESEIPALKTYADSIRPSTIRIDNVVSRATPSASANNAGAGSARPPTTIAIEITTPESLSSNKVVDITGGILPPPFPLRRAQPGATASPTPTTNPATATQPVDGPRPTSVSNGNQAGIVGGTATGDQMTPGTASPSSAARPPDEGRAGNSDNLLTYSSKPYHDDAGWVFNPSTGFWQNPNDASETRMPGIITCCDDTGLAFPNDALEAQQNFWDIGGVDPNCGRLYTCDSGADPQPAADASPDDQTIADAKDKIRKALDYIRGLPMTDEERRQAIENFIKDLPDDYILLARQMARPYMRVAGGGGTVRMIQTPSGPVGRGFSGGAFRPQTNNQSTITGLGGGVSSHYVPVTQSFAANMTTKYPVVPTCK